MMEIFNEKITALAKSLPVPLYAVGGYVRNYLINQVLSSDLDLASTLSEREMAQIAQNFGFKVIAEYKRTKTVVFSDGKIKYEYTAFRKDEYVKGEHKPRKTVPTADIYQDAIRRDFKCNAIYQNIATCEIVDPLNGIFDIENKVIDTVKNPDEVFCFDGLRLMRLARFSAELNFKPSERVIKSAKKYCDNILDISVERITEELKKILCSDKKYPFSDKCGHYTGIKLLHEIGVLGKIFPCLKMGEGMAQRSDFHNHDVLEHSFLTVLYAKCENRIPALLHDAGKPIAMQKDKRFHFHYLYGEKTARKTLKKMRLKKSEIEDACFLIRYHMFDTDLGKSEQAVRKFIVKNFKYYDRLIDLKQADYMAGKDKTDVCPTVKKWRKILEKAKKEGVPFSLKDLKISASDLIAIGYKKEEIGKELNVLFDYCILHPEKDREFLIKKAIIDYKKSNNIDKVK